MPVVPFENPDAKVAQQSPKVDPTTMAMSEAMMIEERKAEEWQHVLKAGFSWEKQTSIPRITDDLDKEGWTVIESRNGRSDTEILKKVPDDHEAFFETRPAGKTWMGTDYPAEDYIWIRKKPKEKPKLEELVS